MSGRTRRIERVPLRDPGTRRGVQEERECPSQRPSGDRVLDLPQVLDRAFSAIDVEACQGIVDERDEVRLNGGCRGVQRESLAGPARKGLPLFCVESIAHEVYSWRPAR